MGALAQGAVSRSVFSRFVGNPMWVAKGFQALADQVSISGSNFLLGILVARWLGPEQYGAYAIALSLLILISGFHQSIILEPMSVLGPAKYAGDRSYLGAVTWLNTGFCALTSPLFAALAAGVVWAGGAGAVKDALLGVAVAAPLVFTFWLFRCACYMGLAPGAAAAAGFQYSILVLGGAAALHRLGVLTTRSAFVLMGASSAVAAARTAWKLRPAILAPGIKSLIGETARAHFGYGRWASGTALLSWLEISSFYSITGFLLSVAEAGALAAILNFLLPAGHVFQALSRLALPHLSRVFAEGGAEATQSRVQRFVLLTMTGAFTYVMVATVLRGPLFAALYGHRFVEFSYLMPLAVCCLVFSLAGAACDVGLRAIQAPQRVFSVHVVTGITSIAAGVPLTYVVGLPGTVATLMVSALVYAAVSYSLYRRELLFAKATA